MKRRVELLEFDDFLQELYLYLGEQIQREQGEVAVMQDGIDNMELEKISPVNVAMIQSIRTGISSSESKIRKHEMAQRAIERFIAQNSQRAKDAKFREVYSQMVLYHEEVKTFIELEAKSDKRFVIDQGIAVRRCEIRLAELGYPVKLGIETYRDYLERHTSKP